MFYRKSAFIIPSAKKLNKIRFTEVLVPGANEAELQAKIAEIKKKSGMFDNVSSAAGYCVLRAGMDPRKALSEADEMMYADKENCYRENPELRRD